MDPVPPATTIAASTGPAHGTYSAPSVRPSPKPLLPLTVRPVAGFARTAVRSGASAAGRSVRDRSAVSVTSAAHRIASWGRCRADNSAEPASVTTLKLQTRPAITRYGRAPVPDREEHHREHRQDARRDAGDQAAQKPDQRDGLHDCYSVSPRLRTGRRERATASRYTRRHGPSGVRLVLAALGPAWSAPASATRTNAPSEQRRTAS